jgi:hypothetical protein
MRAPALIALFLLACATTVQARPKQGEPCDEQGKCARGLTCMKYYGVAGARGPQMTSCEIPCGEGAIKGKKLKCPKGQSCTTVADGPGQVCRAADTK